MNYLFTRLTLIGQYPIGTPMPSLPAGGYSLNISPAGFREWRYYRYRGDFYSGVPIKEQNVPKTILTILLLLGVPT